jgi:tRNA dimethylallyltransferase
MPSAKPKIVVVLGPTAVGKTELSLQLAERLGAEIVSADSRLLYRGMDIGTAKPSAQQLAHITHHLIDVADPDATWSLADFQAAVETAISDISERGRLPFLVGGSGQYLRAILQGWSPPALEADPALRRTLEAWAADIGKQGLHDRLASLDPPAAARIDARNLRRTVRALEVIFSTGQLFSAQRMQGQTRYQSLQIGLTLPRPELFARIDARIEAMLRAGWLDECRRLLAQGYSPDLPALSAIGYRQLTQHIKGEISLEEAVVQIKRATRVFVRRQGNWFKPADPTIHWFEAGNEGMMVEIEKLIERFLSE